MKLVSHGSLARRFARVAVTMILAVASVPALSASAAADDFAPEILSFTRQSGEVISGGAAVTISFSALDEGPAGLGFAMFTYGTPLGAEFRVDSEWMNRAAQGTFTATKNIGLWAASGSYELEKVEVNDREGNSTVYERVDGGFDFTSADFTVQNPNEDTTVPTLGSATLFQTTVRQGTPVVILYDARDDLSGVESVVFFGWTPTGAQYWISSLPELGAVGPASWLVPLESPAGAYESFGVQVFDRAGNSMLYRTDGRYPYPPNATAPPHTSPDLTALNFSVEGVVGDRTAPTMTEVSMLTPRTRRPGDLVALDFSASDDGTGIEQVGAAWTDGRGHQIEASKTCGDLTGGPLSVEVQDYRSVDTDWQLQYVVFADYLGNQSVFRRDGTVAYQNSDLGAPTHGFDLTQGDFHLESGGASPHEWPDTTRQWCPKVADVTLEVDDPTVISGESVISTGEVTDGGDAIPDPIVAIHEYIDGVPELSGVVQGDASGQFRNVLVPHASSRIRATFLGADGPRGGNVTRSRGVAISVRFGIGARLTSDRIRLGTSTTLTGAVTPSDAGGSVWLQRKSSSGWKNVREGHVTTGGSYSFTLRPTRTGLFRFRVVKRASELLARGMSTTKVLEVRRV